MDDRNFIVYSNLIKYLIPFRGLKYVSTMLKKDIINDSESAVRQEFEINGQLRVVASGKYEKNTIFYIFSKKGYSLSTPSDFKTHLSGIDAAEVVIVIDGEFLDTKKKNIKEYIVDTTYTLYLNGSGPYFSIIHYDKLYINLNSHVSMPYEYKIISEIEFEKEKMGQIPSILTSDALCMWLGARENDIIMAVEPSEVSLLRPVYRRVKRAW